MTVQAGERLGLFARTGQLSLKSGEGAVDVQAQNGSMRLFAEKKLTISSASDISFAGKKRITLIGGGSYLRLEAGKVEYGTMASYLRKVKRTMTAAAQSMPMAFPRMSSSHIYSAIYRLLDKHGNILVNIPCRLTTPSGQTVMGYSDNEGRSVPVYTRQQEMWNCIFLLKNHNPKKRCGLWGKPIRSNWKPNSGRASHNGNARFTRDTDI